MGQHPGANHRTIVSHIDRHFLGWDKPFLELLASKLLDDHSTNGQADLSQLSIFLPGRRAARNLLDQLAYAAKALNLALTPPLIMPVGMLILHTSPQPEQKEASTLEQLLAWYGALDRLSPQQQQIIVGRQQVGSLSFTTVLPVLKKMMELHQTIAAVEKTFASVYQLLADATWAVPAEVERWQGLETLQNGYIQHLLQMDRSDTYVNQMDAVLDNHLSTGQTIILGGLIDMNPLQQSAIRHLASGGAVVDVMIAAPEQIAGGFDDLGNAERDYWLKADLEMGPDNYIDVAQAADQAMVVQTMLQETMAFEHPQQTTLVLPDTAILPLIETQLALASSDLSIHFPQRQRLRQTATGRLLQLTSDHLAAHDYDTLAQLLRHPDVGAHLSPSNETTDKSDVIELLDELYGEHLGSMDGTSPRLQQVSTQKQQQLRYYFEQFGSLVQPFGDGTPHSLQTWIAPIQIFLGLVYNTPLDDQNTADRHLLRSIEIVRDGLKQFAQASDATAIDYDLIVGANNALHILLALVGDEVFADEPTPQEIDAVGYLEVYLDEAALVIVTSFNQGIVPESFHADPFLPGRLRQGLGLPTTDDRYARDACITHALIHSHYRRVWFIASSETADGSPALPSRLTLATGQPEKIAQRFLEFTNPIPVSGERQELNENKKVLFIRQPETTPVVQKMSVTSFKTYLDNPWFYYLRHVLKLDSIDDQHSELDPRLFGSIAHDILDQFGRCDCATTSDQATIFNYLQQQLRAASLDRFGQHPDAVIQVQLKQLEQRLDWFSQWQSTQVDEGWTIEATEQFIESDQCPLDLGQGQVMHLAGRIDRVDRHKDGAVRIIDYKTGESGKTPRQNHLLADGSWIDLQLPLYYFAYRCKEPATRIGVGYLNLTNSGHYGFDAADGRPGERNNKEAWGDAVIDDAMAVAHDVAAAVAHGAFPDEPRSTAILRHYPQFAAIRHPFDPQKTEATS